MLSFSHFITRGFSQFVSLGIWWYGRGLWLVTKRLAFLEKREFLRVGVHTWMRNFLVPMFQDYTWVGRILSGFFRLFIIIGKLVRLAVTFAVRMVLLVMWIVLPFVFAGGLINYFAQ